MKVRDRMLIDKGFSAAEQWRQRSFASGGFLAYSVKQMATQERLTINVLLQYTCIVKKWILFSYVMTEQIP